MPLTAVVAVKSLTHTFKYPQHFANIIVGYCSKDDKLTKVQTVEASDIPVEQAPLKKYDCDICKESTPAVMFCVDCGKKSCNAHKQVLLLC